MKDRLTKTAYLRYLSCRQEFWLDHHQPLLAGAEPITIEHEHLRQQGYAVERYVKQLVRFQPAEGTFVDYQRTFQTADFSARADIVVTQLKTGVIDIYEVKAAGAVKEEHLDDISFQKMVAEKAGATIGRCFVITMNGEYVRYGDIDVEQLLLITEVTEKIAERMALTDIKAKEAIAYLDTVPVASLLDYCSDNKLDCKFIRLHFKDLPDYTIFDIQRLNNDKRQMLLAQNVIDIRHVPDDFKLSAKQRRHVTAAQTGVIHIDYDEIAKRVASWEYPLQFLDYETFAYAIPQFEGVRPFQQMCFQYSLHTIDAPGAEMRHSYFLSKGDDDPPHAMAAKLKEDLAGGIGTVFVWYEGFEKTRNTEMAVMFPELADFFEEVNAKTYDLMKIFSDCLYVHPKFKGRSSIKKVLPILRPNLSYADLDIGDGLTATIKWFRAATWPNLDEAERDKIFADLEKYCELDTLAMVEIFKVLTSLAKAQAA